MAIREYIETHPVFTTGELVAACGDTQTNRNLLSRAVRSGAVERVRRGCYVSRVGSAAGRRPGRHEVALALCGRDVVFSYQSALEFYGCAHDCTPRYVAVQGARRLDVEWDGLQVSSWVVPDVLDVRDFGGRSVTSPAQTFVDCLARPNRACGIENVLRSVPGLPVDADECMAIAERRGTGTLRKVGFVLDRLGRDVGDGWRAHLDGANPPGGTSFLGGSWRGERVFDAAWRVYLPAPAGEWLRRERFSPAEDGHPFSERYLSGWASERNRTLPPHRPADVLRDRLRRRRAAIREGARVEA